MDHSCPSRVLTSLLVFWRMRQQQQQQQHLGRRVWSHLLRVDSELYRLPAV